MGMGSCRAQASPQRTPARLRLGGPYGGLELDMRSETVLLRWLASHWQAMRAAAKISW